MERKLTSTLACPHTPRIRLLIDGGDNLTFFLELCQRCSVDSRPKFIIREEALQ